MVDVMPTVLALAGAKGSPDHPFDGKDIWPTLAENQPSPHDDYLINVEAFRGAIRKGNWKLVQIALLPGKIELFDLSKDLGEKNNVAAQFPEIESDLQARLVAYAKEMKPSLWIKVQPTSSAHKVKQSSIQTSTSTTAAYRTKRLNFQSDQIGWRMSDMGQTRSCGDVRDWSALPPIATKERTSRQVRVVPKHKVAALQPAARGPEPRGR